MQQAAAGAAVGAGAGAGTGAAATPTSSQLAMGSLSLFAGFLLGSQLAGGSAEGSGTQKRRASGYNHHQL